MWAQNMNVKRAKDPKNVDAQSIWLKVEKECERQVDWLEPQVRIKTVFIIDIVK